MIIIYERIMGQWKDDKLNGQGIYVWSNGDRYEGEFKQGNADGQGMKYYVNGKKEAGTWENWIFLD